MIHRTLRALIIAGALLLLCSGGSVDENAPDAADWQSFSDEKVLEYLDNPFAGVRIYAGLEILRRWDEKKIIAHLEKNWKQGEEILYAGAWPGKGAALETYLLGRTSPDRQRDAALLLAGRFTPDDPRYAGAVGSLVRDLWFSEWITRIPHDVFFIGTVNRCLRHSWVRERLYRDDAWISSWGAHKESAGKMWYSWRLREYRATVQILAGDPYSPQTQHLIDTTQYFPVLVEVVKTGKHAGLPAVLKSQMPAGIDDALASSYIVDDKVGSVTYAELLAIVVDRPDWIPTIHKLLEKVEHVTQTPVLDPRTGKILRIDEKVTHQDRRSPLIALMSEVSDHRNEAAKASFRAYWRREWYGYKDSTWDEDLWRRHPWMTRIDKDLRAWYGVEAKPLVGDVDCEFLKGTWQ